MSTATTTPSPLHGVFNFINTHTQILNLYLSFASNTSTAIASSSNPAILTFVPDLFYPKSALTVGKLMVDEYGQCLNLLPPTSPFGSFPFDGSVIFLDYCGNTGGTFGWALWNDSGDNLIVFSQNSAISSYYVIAGPIGEGTNITFTHIDGEDTYDGLFTPR